MATWTTLAAAAGLAIVALCGRAHAKPIHAEDFDHFKVGAATAADVEAAEGKPLVVTKNSDGSEMLTYYTTKTRIKGTTFIPIVGAFAGGSTSDSTTVMLTFGADGRLKSISSSTAAFDCHTGGFSAHCDSR